MLWTLLLLQVNDFKKLNENFISCSFCYRTQKRICCTILWTPIVVSVKAIFTNFCENAKTGSRRLSRKWPNKKISDKAMYCISSCRWNLFSIRFIYILTLSKYENNGIHLFQVIVVLLITLLIKAAIGKNKTRILRQKYMIWYRKSNFINFAQKSTLVYALMTFTNVPCHVFFCHFNFGLLLYERLSFLIFRDMERTGNVFCTSGGEVPSTAALSRASSV
jgi:hypothetical protein